MTTSSAALKLSEEAQDLICAYVSDFSNQDAMNTLYSLTLTSRDFLESAQHALYKAPLRALLARPTWSRAESLLQTLKTRPGLALHVRLLYTLDNLSIKLSKLQTELAPPMEFLEALSGGVSALSLDDGKRDPCDWACQIACLCGQATSVSFPLSSIDEARRWKVVANNERLNNIRLNAEAPSKVDLETFKAWAEGWEGKQLRKVSIVGLNWPVDSLDSETPFTRLPFWTRTLELEKLHLTALQLSHCLPNRMLPLKTVTISTYGKEGEVVGFGSGMTFQAVFKKLGQKVSAFTFDALHKYDVADYLEDYGMSHYGPVLTPTTFESFPCATSLTLRRLKGMTVDRLRILAEHSPKLRTLDLDWSAWSIDLSTEVDSLISVLKLFRTLTELNLGYLRVDEGDPYELLPVERWAREAGVTLSYQGCYEDEEHGSECDCDFCEEIRWEEGHYGSDGCDNSECECHFDYY